MRLTKGLLLLFGILTGFASVFLVAQTTAFSDSTGEQIAENSWPMLAANPARTSWTPEEVRGNLSVEWYHPIEAYVPYKIQPIAANGKIYVSTARGLYAFNAANGNVDWVYPTELPLGHSPTIATINGISVAYVGGYDRKVHAVDALTGQAVSGYAPFEAGAGFETNPLIIQDSYTNNQPTIFTGNRDGFFYALDAVTGALKWKYETDGPILFSAAYKNGTIYFASNDAYAYALNASTGAPVWKSSKLLGQGFHSFWPVIYTDKSSGKDYVIVSGGGNYRMSELHLTDTETRALNAIYHTSSSSPFLPATNPLVSGDWAADTVTMDASPILKYFEDYPHRRTVFVLDRSTGQEYTFTDPKTGKQTYAPFTWSGVTQSGSRYPAVINGIDGVYYQQTAYQDYHGWVSRGAAVGWKFGTPYISKTAQETTATDEPTAFSSGGRLIYWVLCCDRSAGAYDIFTPYGQPNRAWGLWGYDMASNERTPGYQQMYNDGDSDLYSQMDGWQIYSGKNQSKNGVYGKHGSAQSPPIPYRGKLFTLIGNALFAWSSTGTNPKTPLPLAAIVSIQNPPTPLSPTEVQQRLETEIQKMLVAGNLRPGYHAAGFIDQYGEGGKCNESELGEIFDYFQNPSDTVFTLLQSLPYLSPTTQTSVRNYLQQYYAPGKMYDITRIAHIGWGEGAQREAFDTPPEAYSANNPDSAVGIGAPYRSPLDPSERPITGGDPANGYGCGYWLRFPPFNFYAAWKYTDQFKDPQNPTQLPKSVFNSMKDKVEAFPDNNSPRRPFLINRPYLLHLYIAGYQGYLELQKLAGYTEDADVREWYNQALSLRMSNFTKDTPFLDGNGNEGNVYHNRSLSIARNFMFLTPEVSDQMSASLKPQVRVAIDEYSYVAPYWFVAQFDASVGEGSLQQLYDYPALFQAKAYILKQPYNELVKYLDVPGFYRGDLFYIQNLVAALSVAGTNPTASFDLDVTPSTQVIDAGGVATYTVQITHGDTFTAPITLQVDASPSSELIVHVDPTGVVAPTGGQTIVTLTDLHTQPLTAGYWYSILITATGGGITRTVSVSLLVADSRVYLPVILTVGG